MNLKHMIGGIAIAAALALSTITPAAADAFDNVNNYMRSQPGAPADFTLDRTEFGKNNTVQVIHLAAEFVVGVVNGYVIVYNPYTGAVDNFGHAGGDGDDHNPGVITNKHCVALAADHPKRRMGGYCDYATSNATLAPKSGGMYYIDTTPAVDRSCTITVNKRGGAPGDHPHTC